MMLGRQEIVKLVLYGLTKDQYDKLKEKYLFSWERIPGNDDSSLVKFLMQNFCIDWVKTAEIRKIDRDTIRVSTENNFLSLKLNDRRNKVDLQIDDNRKDEFIAKTENGRLNIYKENGKKSIIPPYEEPSELIKKYCPTKGLIYIEDNNNHELENLEDILDQIKESGYDLRLGNQYILGEEIKELDDNNNSILKIPPHDVVVVLTYEGLRIPKKIVGTFQLNLTYVLKGLMLANGAQIDPGYDGKLACMLFNLTNKPILLKYKDVFAKISFIQLTESNDYKGKHQGKKRIQQFITDYPTSGLADINEKLKETHRALETLKRDIEVDVRNYIIIILTIVTAIITAYSIFKP